MPRKVADSAGRSVSRIRDPKSEIRNRGPLVAVIMGSKSDWETMRHADETLTEFGVAHECRVMSAHRTPHLSNYRGSGRSSPSRRRNSCAHHPAGAWCANEERCAQWYGFAARHRANAGGHSG